MGLTRAHATERPRKSRRRRIAGTNGPPRPSPEPSRDWPPGPPRPRAPPRPAPPSGSPRRTPVTRPFVARNSEVSVAPVCGPLRRGGHPAGLRARVGLGSPRVPSSFARQELRCSRRPEPRGRAALGGPGGRAAVPVPGPGRHRHGAEPRGRGFPRAGPGAVTTLGFASPGRSRGYL